VSRYDDKLQYICKLINFDMVIEVVGELNIETLCVRTVRITSGSALSYSSVKLGATSNCSVFNLRRLCTVYPCLSIVNKLASVLVQTTAPRDTKTSND